MEQEASFCSNFHHFYISAGTKTVWRKQKMTNSDPIPPVSQHFICEEVVVREAPLILFTQCQINTSTWHYRAPALPKCHDSRTNSSQISNYHISKIPKVHRFAIWKRQFGVCIPSVHCLRKKDLITRFLATVENYTFKTQPSISFWESVRQRKLLTVLKKSTPKKGSVGGLGLGGGRIWGEEIL